MKKLQQNYYTNTHAKNTLEKRIEAIEPHIEKSLSVLDIGCNDGSLSKTLFKKIVGIDLEKTAPFNVIIKDLSVDSFSDLPKTDIFLCLNVLHHIQPRSHELIDTLLNNHLFGFVDMGSVTERGDWNWLKKLKEKYKSDDEVYADLFRNAYYEQILEYPAQGGTRKLFKIWKKNDLFEIEKIYRRTVAGSPNKKKLIEVSSLSEQKENMSIEPDMICPYISFFKLKCGNKYFWGKKHLGNIYYENIIQKKQIFDNWLETLPFNTQTPIFIHPIYGEIYKYNEDIFNGRSLHLNHVQKELSTEEIQTVDNFSETIIEIEGFKNLKIKELTDFQTVKTQKGLIFIDFDLNPGILK